jgi:hypothetical protein
MSDIGVLGLAHHDHRRSIKEFTWPDSSVQFFEVHSDEPLGGHYHEKTTETFCVLKGGGLILLCPVNEMGGAIAEVQSFELKRHSVIRVRPRIAHASYFVSRTEIVRFSSRPFDLGDIYPTPWLIKNQ